MILADGMITLILVLSILGAILGLLAFLMGIFALVELRSFNKSTHQIQYVPIDNEIDKANEEFLQKMGKDPFEDEWATSDKSIAKQNKLYKEELEDKMPEMVDEPDYYSF
jgi:hypothetical protein